MTTLAVWIRKHQITAFLAVTFSFLLIIPLLGFFVWPLFFPMNRIVALYVTRLAIYGPVLAGIIVTRIASGGHREGFGSKRLAAFFISWILICLASVIYHQSLEPLADRLPVTLLIVMPIAFLPAFVISGAFSNMVGIRAYLSSLIHPKGSAAWYLIALLTFPAIHVLGTAIAQVMNSEPIIASWSLSPDLALAAVLTFVRVFLYTGGINEECGWRGFLLTRLQARYCPLIAGLLIWAVHMVWELPGDLLSSGGSWPWLSRLVLMPSWSLLFLWVYNRTNGSILAPVLFHTSMNAMNPLMGIFPVSTPVIILLVLIAVISVVWDKMWLKLPQHHPAVYRGLNTDV